MAGRTFHLYDAALLQDVDWEGHCSAGRAAAVYADLGADALQAGPVLWLREDPPTPLTGNESLARERGWRYGIAELRTMANASTLLNHLKAMRVVELTDGQRFYFRYGDSRSLRGIWAITSTEQQRDLMGPIASWRVYDEHGEAVSLACAMATTSVPALPMRFDHRQFMDEYAEQFLSWQVLVSAEQFDDRVTNVGTDASRLAFARQALTQLRPGTGDTANVLLASWVTIALVLTNGRALTESAFQAALSQATAAGKDQPIRAWLADQTLEGYT